MHPNLFYRLFSLSQQWRWIMISITFGNNNYLIIFLTLMFDNDFDQVWEQLWTLHHYHIWPQSPVGEINEARLFSQFFQFCKKKDSCLPYLDFLYGPVFLYRSCYHQQLKRIWMIYYTSYFHHGPIRSCKSRSQNGILECIPSRMDQMNFFSCGTLTAIMIRIISRPFWRLR